MAVLRVVTLGAESEIQFLASQITLLVTNALSKISGIRVLAHSTVKHYEALDKSPQEIGQDLRVRDSLNKYVSDRASFVSLKMLDFGATVGMC